MKYLVLQRVTNAFFTGFLFSLKFFLDQFFIKTFSSFIYFGTGNYMPDIKKFKMSLIRPLNFTEIEEPFLTSLINAGKIRIN